MALRPIVALSLLTFAFAAGCSDGPPSGDLVAIPGAFNVDGSTSTNEYVPESGGMENPAPGGQRICQNDPTGTVPACIEASSTYAIHFMSLPEPSGEGYKVYQRGGAIEEHHLCDLLRGSGDMWECTMTNEGDESAQFEALELRMGDLLLATASSAAGSQAFVANPALAAVTVTGSYDGRALDLDIAGLPEGPVYNGRFYTIGLSGNLTLAESFIVTNGQQKLRTEQADVGDYAEFHIHVGESKVYVYQSTI